MNKFEYGVKPLVWLSAMLMVLAAAGCGGGSSGQAATAAAGITIVPGAVGAMGGASAEPSVRSASPAHAANDVATSQRVGLATSVTAVFSQAMNPATINSAVAGSLLTFTLKETSGSNVPGTVAMNAASTAATFTPTASGLAPNTHYTATVSTAAKNAMGVAMSNPVAWTFTTQAVASIGRSPVNLGTAGKFTILTKSGISTVPGSRITGDIGVSPIAQTAITGFSLTTDASNTFASSTQVIGKVHAADYAAPTPAYLTDSVGDMEIAYADAAGRALPDFTERGAGEIGGLTLVPGLYKWSTGLSIASQMTLAGKATDVWIFQVAGDIPQASSTQVILTGGALAKNVFWQVAGGAGVTIGTSAHFEGIILSATAINLRTGASANSQLLAQTAVNLQQNVVTRPGQ